MCTFIAMRRSLTVLSAATLAAGVLAGAQLPLAPSTSAAGPTTLPGVEEAGPIPLYDAATGPQWAPLPVGVAQMPSGSVFGEVQPLIHVPDLEPVASAEIRVVDLVGAAAGGDGAVWSGQVLAGWARVGQRLTIGRTYRVEARETGGTWVAVGSFVLRSRSQLGTPTVSVGGISVSSVTGDVSWHWASQSLAGPVGLVGVGLTWNSGGVTEPGLPSGWQLIVNSGSPWKQLIESVRTERIVQAPSDVRITTDGRRVALTVGFPRDMATRVDAFPVRAAGNDGVWRMVGRVTLAEIIAKDASRLTLRKSDTQVQVGVRVDGTFLWGDPISLRTGRPTVRSVRANLPTPAQDIAVPGTAPQVVRVVGWDGQVVVFERNGLGVYEQATGSGATPGFVNRLTRTDDGIWEFTDTQSFVTRFVNGYATSVRLGDKPVSQLVWDRDGRVVSVRNEIGRKIDLVYGNCDTWTGFTAAPEGALCRVDFPGGVSTEFGYVETAAGEQIGLIKDPGNQGVALGWDNRARLVAERSQLASRAAAVSPSAPQSLSEIAYDEKGRAATLVSAPGAVGDEVATQSISFPVVTEGAIRKWSGSSDIRDAVQGVVSVSAPPSFDLAKRTWFDPITWQPLTSRDASGLETSLVANGRSSTITNGQGLDYTTSYNNLGLPIKSMGPFKGGDGVTISSTYDADFVNGKVKPWLGLRAQVFSRYDYAGDPRLQFWESSANRGGLSFTWRDRDGEWSGQATGIWTPEAVIDKRGNEKGWTFRFDSSRAGAARLIVGSTPCIPDSSQTCVIRDLPIGPKSVTIELPRAGAVGYFAVSAAAGGDALMPLPFDSIVPGYTTPTTTQINDLIPGEARPISVTKYDNPASGVVSAHIIPGGLRTAYTYEGVNDEQDRWGRNLTRTTPGGEVQTMSYWPSSGTTSLPAVCGAATVALLGLPKSTQRQDGTSMQNFYDGRGRAVASVIRDIRGDVAQTACVVYRDDDSVAASTLYNADGVVIDRSITNDAVEGNPLVTSTVVTHGPAAPVAKGESFTTTVTLDLLGRPVRTEDSTGTVTTTTYNAFHSVVREESTAPGGARFVRVNDYRAVDGKLASVSINGQRAATIGYDNRTGRPESVTYPNGISTTMSYFGNGNVNRVSSTAAGSSYLSTSTLSEFGRVLGNELSVTGARTYSESRSYTYDEAGRLVSTQIGSTGANAIPTVTYEYGFGNQSSSCGSSYLKAGDDALRTSGSRNGVDYTTCYDGRGRISSTTDPLVTGDPAGVDSATMTHDGLGRLVKIDGVARPVEFTYGVGGELARISEGPADSRVITTFNSFFGSIVSKTVDSVAGSHSVTYAGPFLIDGRRLVATQYALPGGVNVTINAGQTAALTLAGVDGSAIATVAVPALGAGKTADIGLADRFGPFGEPLITPSTAPDSAVPEYSWQSAERHETLPGTSSVTILGSRAYLPSLGMFLSTDPQPESGLNLYSYTMGDPINTNDKSGNDTIDTVFSTSGALIGFAISAFVGRFWRGAWGAAAGIASSVGVGVAGYIAAASLGLDTTSSILVGVGAGVSSLGVFGLSRWRLTKSFDYQGELMMARNQVGRDMVSFEKELFKMSKVERISDPRFIARMGQRANRNLAKKADAFTKVSGARTRIAVISDRSFLPIRTKVVRREIGGRLDQIIEESDDLLSLASNSLRNSSSL